MSSLNLIVKDYIKHHRANAANELRWIKIQQNFEEALFIATYAICPCGKRFSHQRRIPNSVLSEAHKKLLICKGSILCCKSFDDLYQIVFSEIHSIHGIGDLTVYDTTLRIGAWLKIEPVTVFLHAGTRVGAKRLGLNASRKVLTLSEVPTPLRKLLAREIEDVLCIYKNSFSTDFPQKNLPLFVRPNRPFNSDATSASCFHHRNAPLR